MTSWYEFEELVGRRWHRWAAGTASYPSHPEAAAELAPLRDVLGVYFHAVGGPRSLTVTTSSALGSGHRLTLRQRLGLEREPMELARRDEENLVLPGRIAYFPDPDLNRDLYFWLTAYLAEANTVAPARDPLQSDLLALAEAARASRVVADGFPGLGERYGRLRRALLATRPRRRLPAVEASLEAVIVHLLGGDQALDDTAQRMLSAIAALSDESAPLPWEEGRAATFSGVGRWPPSGRRAATARPCRCPCGGRCCRVRRPVSARRKPLAKAVRRARLAGASAPPSAATWTRPTATTRCCSTPSKSCCPGRRW
jgi:nitric oxide reductase activation protein